MASSSAKKGKEKSKQPTTKSKWAQQDDDDDVENPDFQSTYFPTTNHQPFLPYVYVVYDSSFLLCRNGLHDFF